MTKTQRRKLLRAMRADSIKMLGESSVFDELLPLLEPIEKFINAEVKATKSRNSKTRARAERRILEIGQFGMELMNRLTPLYLKTMWQIEHALKNVQSSAK